MVSARVVADVMAEPQRDPRDPLEKELTDLQNRGRRAVGRQLPGHDGPRRSGAHRRAGIGHRISDRARPRAHQLARGGVVADTKVAPADVVVRFDYTRDTERRGGLVHRRAPRGRLGWSTARPGVRSTSPRARQALPALDELDFAVLRLSGPQSGVRRTMARRAAWVALPKQTKVSPGQSVLILQHPSGHPLRLAFDGVLSLNGNGTRVRYRARHAPGLHRGRRPSIRTGSSSHSIMRATRASRRCTTRGIPAAAIRALLDKRGKVTLPDA